MKLTSREIVDSWMSQEISLTGVERALELPYGCLMSLLENEGPAEPEMETLLNMINLIPSLIHVADEDFKINNE